MSFNPQNVGAGRRLQAVSGGGRLQMFIKSTHKVDMSKFSDETVACTAGFMETHCAWLRILLDLRDFSLGIQL